jgi:hypothetical protein
LQDNINIHICLYNVKYIQEKNVVLYKKVVVKAT